jgi:hypothetical protein
MHKLTIVFVTMLLAFGSSETMAKSPKVIRHYDNSGVVALPQDPQAYAMAVARVTWPGRPLCDDGGYRIRPCDMYPSRR